MRCLFNGEYGEHDLSHISGLEQTRTRQSVSYLRYIGIIVGDFTVLDVEYDWGRRDQRWHIRCNLCGEEDYLYNASDWRRGKGRSTKCKCRKQNPEKPQKIKRPPWSDDGWVGQEFSGWTVIEFSGDGQFLVECTQCGKKVKKPCFSLVSDKASVCNHVIPNDYTTDDWIGKRSGHLTVIRREGKCFRTRCDCGRESVVRPTDMFTSQIVQTCGNHRCQYHQNRKNNVTSVKALREGHEHERRVAELFRSHGYDVELTTKSGDFGVDMLVNWSDNHKLAVQIKLQKRGAGVDSVQQVYAGGRFYDCDMFSVISVYGFTDAAKRMAAKLGVYLADKTFEFPDDIGDFCNNLLPVYRSRGKGDKQYELNGEEKPLSEWCTELGADEITVKGRLDRGITLENALSPTRRSKQRFTILGMSGSLAEICRHFGVLPASVSYRMKQRGMTLEGAIRTPFGKPDLDKSIQLKLLILETLDVL